MAEAHWVALSTRANGPTRHLGRPVAPRRRGSRGEPLAAGSGLPAAQISRDPPDPRYLECGNRGGEHTRGRRQADVRRAEFEELSRAVRAARNRARGRCDRMGSPSLRREPVASVQRAIRSGSTAGEGYEQSAPPGGGGRRPPRRRVSCITAIHRWRGRIAPRARRRSRSRGGTAEGRPAGLTPGQGRWRSPHCIKASRTGWRSRPASVRTYSCLVRRPASR